MALTRPATNYVGMRPQNVPRDVATRLRQLGVIDFHVRSGYMDGQTITDRMGLNLMLSIAPSKPATAAFILVDAIQRRTQPIYCDELINVRAWSDARTLYGFGPKGIIVSGLLAETSRFISGWDLYIEARSFAVHLHAPTGEPPEADLARLRVRMNEAALA